MIDFRGTKKYILTRLENELKPNLYYHGIHHTLDVYEVSIKIGELEGLSQEEKLIINTAALYHDSGFMFQYAHNEVLAVKLIQEVLPSFGYTENQINRIGDIILTTRIKARPFTLLDKVMCDADYDYLGRKDVAAVAKTLYDELHEHGYTFSEDDWNIIQIKFLKKHKYYTPSAIAMRRENKWEYINQLEKL